MKKIKKRKEDTRLCCTLCNIFHPRGELHDDCTHAFRIKVVAAGIIGLLKKRKIFLRGAIRSFKKMQSSPRKIVEEGLFFYERIQKSFSSRVLATTGVEFSQLFTKGLERLEALLFKTKKSQGMFLAH